MRQGIFLPESASGADSFMASVLRECAGAGISILLYLLPLIVCRHPVDDSDDELGGVLRGFPGICCPRAHVLFFSICVSTHITNPKHWQAYHCLDTQK